MPQYRAFRTDTTLPASDPNAVQRYEHDGDPYREFIYCFDANGNVGQLVDWSATYAPNDPNSVLAARYEYTPYGQVSSALGDYADENPMRFSTKVWDDETGLGNWGRRYYDGVRWLTRDPIQEACDLHVYRFLSSAPTMALDALGLATLQPGHDPWSDMYGYLSFDYSQPRGSIDNPYLEKESACQATIYKLKMDLQNHFRTLLARWNSRDATSCGCHYQIEILSESCNKSKVASSGFNLIYLGAARQPSLDQRGMTGVCGQAQYKKAWKLFWGKTDLDRARAIVAARLKPTANRYRCAPYFKQVGDLTGWYIAGADEWTETRYHGSYFGGGPNEGYPWIVDPTSGIGICTGVIEAVNEWYCYKTN